MNNQDPQLHTSIEENLNEFEKLISLEQTIYSLYDNKPTGEAKIVLKKIDERLDVINQSLTEQVEQIHYNHRKQF